MARQTLRHRAARFVARWQVQFLVGTVVLYALLVPMTALLWPASDLTIQITVLITGILSTLAALGAVLVGSVDTPEEEKPVAAGMSKTFERETLGFFPGAIVWFLDKDHDIVTSTTMVDHSRSHEVAGPIEVAYARTASGHTLPLDGGPRTVVEGETFTLVLS